MQRPVIAMFLVMATLAGAPALAQGPLPDTLRSAGVTVAQVDSARRGLVAQYELALIRERRLADQREIGFINEAMARLTEARARADAGGGAVATLEQARQAFADLVGQIAARDAIARVEVEAYRAETQRQTTEATPERLAALQRFADGDRVGAWPVLEALRLAEDRAAEAASNARRAVRWREDAELIESMRLNGEKTARDVLQVLNEAARLDPTHFATQERRAELAFLIDDKDTALAALDAAERTIRTDEQRIRVVLWRGVVARSRRQYVEEHRFATRAVEMGRRAVAANPNDPALTSQLISALDALARVNVSHYEPFLATAAAEEGVAVSRALVSAYPGEAAYSISLVRALLSLGDAQNDIMNLTGARAHYEEALTTLESAANGRSSDLRELHLRGSTLSALAFVQSLLGLPQLSRQNLAESVRITEAVERADYGNLLYAQSRENVGTHQALELAMGSAERRKARAIRELAEMREYARAHPGDAETLDALALHCMMLARAHGDLGERDEASPLIDESLGYARRVADSNGGSFDYQDSLYDMLSDASELRARFGDVAAGRALGEEALRSAQAGMRLDPEDIPKQGDVLEVMWTLRSRFQSSHVGWVDIVTFLTRLERRRELSAHEQDRLALARANAAREFRR